MARFQANKAGATQWVSATEFVNYDGVEVCPSESFVFRPAEALDADSDELLLSNRVPQSIMKRIWQRPEAFRTFAELDDDPMKELGDRPRAMRWTIAPVAYPLMADKYRPPG